MTIDREAIVARRTFLIDLFDHPGWRVFATEMTQDIPDLLAEVDRLAAQLAAANADRERMRAALEVYADEANWSHQFNMDGDPLEYKDDWIYRHNDRYNGYDVARAALAAAGGENDG